MASSPWGTIQYSEHFMRGVCFVSTSSHGGLRLAPGFVQKYIPEKIRKYLIYQGGYYYAEEDCAIYIPAAYSMQLCGKFYAIRSESHQDLEFEEWRQKIVMEGLKRWYPEIYQRFVDAGET